MKKLIYIISICSTLFLISSCSKEGSYISPPENKGAIIFTMNTDFLKDSSTFENIYIYGFLGDLGTSDIPLPLPLVIEKYYATSKDFALDFLVLDEGEYHFSIIVNIEKDYDFRDDMFANVELTYDNMIWILGAKVRDSPDSFSGFANIEIKKNLITRPSVAVREGNYLLPGGGGGGGGE